MSFLLPTLSSENFQHLTSWKSSPKTLSCQKKKKIKINNQKIYILNSPNFILQTNDSYWKMLQETLAKPHEQSGLYKYRESEHASELKTKLYSPRAYNLISTKTHFFKRAMGVSVDKKQNK